jgi:DNA-binding winged helix-turn-helix (wHTH) protein
MSASQVLEFASFRLDLADERLWHGHEVLRLTPKAFAVLRCLTAQPGQLVTKDRLMDTVWPETAISESTLTGCVWELRQVLGDVARTPQYIETVHGRGYRFIAPIMRAELSSAIPATHRPQPSAMPAPMTLVGRAAAWAQMQQWLASACQGKRQIGFITGEAGIGKTALVEAFVAQVTATADIWIGHGQCIEQYGAGEPYLPVLEALGRLCRGAHGAHLVSHLRQYAPSWLAQMPALLTSDEREALQRQGNGMTRDRMLRELSEALDLLTHERPLLLVLEGLHWSDVSTLEWLAYVARHRDPARLMILGTYRPVDAIVRAHPLPTVIAELLQHDHCAELILDYLSAAAVADYLTRRFGAKPLPDDLPRVLRQRTNGNPLFLITVVNTLVAQGILEETDRAWRLRGGYEAMVGIVPESLRLLIERYVEQLPPADQAILEAASVTGNTFSVAAVAAGVGGPRSRSSRGVRPGSVRGASSRLRARKPGPTER